MAKRDKQSQWQPVGIEALRAVQQKYPPDTLNKIIECAEVSDPAKCKQLRRAVSRTAAWLNVDQHFEQRPSIKEMRTVFEQARKQVADLWCALRRFDHDSRLALYERASLDPYHSEEPPPDVFGSLGKIRTHNVERGLVKLYTWLGPAYVGMEKGKRGPPRKKALFRATCQLAHAWAIARGEVPTRRYDSQDAHREIGSFRKFANAALEPLNVPVSDDMAKRAIASVRFEARNNTSASVE